MSDTISLFSWNVNGLRAVARKGFFFDFLKDYSPDILCIQETKAHPDQLSPELRTPEGYCSFFSSSEEKKGYSGVATYAREIPLSVEHGFSLPRFDREGRILILHYPEFILYNIYFPNGKASDERLAYKMDFYAACLKRAVADVARGRNVIICGDVNTAHAAIDLARPKENARISGFLPEERAWIDGLLSHGFVDTFRMFTPEGGHYSWWDLKSRARGRDVGWRIDYFFVNSSFIPHVRDSFILKEVMGSDHCPVGIVIDV